MFPEILGCIDHFRVIFDELVCGVCSAADDRPRRTAGEDVFLFRISR